MASIFKRRNKYSVVYTYLDKDGNKRQKWETFHTQAEAKKRKQQVEYQQDTGEFIVPTATTLKDLMEEYFSIYGVNNWALSTYEAKRGVYFHYIEPIIGDMRLDEITTRVLDNYYQNLLKVKPVATKYHRPKAETLTPHTIREVHKMLRNAFNQAVKWELMNKNPAINATVPKEDHKERDIWTAETLIRALELCEDEVLSLAINLAFACSLRMGEMLGLTSDCIDVSPEAIENGTAYIYVNKELQRVNRDSLENLGDKGVMHKFAPCGASAHTMLILKEPKTPSSVRKVFLPKTVARMVVEQMERNAEYKELLGDEYMDNGLLFCHNNGRPMEGQLINKALDRLIKENNLPKVVFHSLRHASITYKLKLNGGDIKAVQGDSGHAQVKMVTDIYSHIIDDDRRVNAQKLEEAFYTSVAKHDTEKEPADVREEPQGAEAQEGTEEKEVPVKESDTALLLKLLQKPETAALIKALAASM